MGDPLMSSGACQNHSGPLPVLASKAASTPPELPSAVCTPEKMFTCWRLSVKSRFPAVVMIPPKQPPVHAPLGKPGAVCSVSTPFSYCAPGSRSCHVSVLSDMFTAETHDARFGLVTVSQCQSVEEAFSDAVRKVFAQV